MVQKQIDKSSQKTLEEYRSTLALLNTKNIALHEKRFEVIGEMYKLIVDLHMALLKLTNPVKVTENYDEEIDKQISHTNDCFQSFNTFFEKNRLFFNNTTCQLVEEIRKNIYSAILDFNEHIIYRKLDREERQGIKGVYQKMIKAYATAKEDIPKLRQNLEANFKVILNVD